VLHKLDQQYLKDNNYTEKNQFCPKRFNLKFKIYRFQLTFFERPKKVARGDKLPDFFKKIQWFD